MPLSYFFFSFGHSKRKGQWNLNSLTRNQTLALCSGSGDSEPLECRELSLSELWFGCLWSFSSGLPPPVDATTRLGRTWSLLFIPCVPSDYCTVPDGCSGGAPASFLDGTISEWCFKSLIGMNCFICVQFSALQMQWRSELASKNLWVPGAQFCILLSPVWALGSGVPLTRAEVGARDGLLMGALWASLL